MSLAVTCVVALLADLSNLPIVPDAKIAPRRHGGRCETTQGVLRERCGVGG
jgi:hypothetical protein